MLVCLLKTNSNVKVSVVKFEDRIWVGEDGNADVSRRFWLKVDTDSPPLSMVRCFLSHKFVRDVEPLSEFSDLRTYPFNDRERFTGIVDIVKGRVENTIDGIRYRSCRLNPESIDLVEVGEGLSLDIDFSAAPLAPDSVYLIPFKFTIANFVDFAPLQTLGEIYFDFCYFLHAVPDMYACIEENMAIPVVPLSPPDEGGFAVFLYAPPQYQLIPADVGVSEGNVTFDYRGNPIDLRSGLIWQLSECMRQKSMDPLSERINFANGRFSFGFRVAGKIVERVLPSEVRSELGKLQHKVTRSNIIAWVALAVAAAGLIAFIVSFFVCGQ